MTRSAIVTGASSGIGRAAAKRLGADGFAVLAVGREDRALREICQEIDRGGGRAWSFVADVTASDAPARIVAAAIERSGGIDAVVNAAGIIATGSVMDTADAGWDAMMDVNVRAPFRLIREAAGALAERRG